MSQRWKVLPGSCSYCSMQMVMAPADTRISLSTRREWAALRAQKYLPAFEGFSSESYSADGSVLIGLSGTTEMVIAGKILANGVELGSKPFPSRRRTSRSA